MLLAMTGSAYAALVDPRPPYPGEIGRGCHFVECDLQYKAEGGQVEPGEWTEWFDGDYVTVRVYENDAGKTIFDFESSMLVKKVAVKGGSATNEYSVDGHWIYDYTALGGVYADTGLRAPDNDAG